MGDCTLLILSRHDVQGASSRLRTNQYVPYLKNQGFDVEVAPFFDCAYLARLYRERTRRWPDLMRAYAKRISFLLKARRFDLIWVEKELLPFAPGWFEGWLSRVGIPYVVDYDDATFHTYDEHRSGLVRAALGRKLAPLLRGSFAVTAGNAYLENYAKKMGAKNVLRIPTVVDLRRYQFNGEPQSSKEIRIGWIGTPATAKYLDLLKNPLQEVARRLPLKFVGIGAPHSMDLGVPTEVVSWSEETEASSLSTIDIGVMPLPDEPWERGKCGYKLIQYMALGKPVIASPVGVNVELVTEEVGRLAAGAKEWSAAIWDLGQDCKKRSSLGAAGRKMIETRYSLQAQEPIVANLFRDALRWSRLQG